MSTDPSPLDITFHTHVRNGTAFFLVSTGPSLSVAGIKAYRPPQRRRTRVRNFLARRSPVEPTGCGLMDTGISCRYFSRCTSIAWLLTGTPFASLIPRAHDATRHSRTCLCASASATGSCVSSSSTNATTSSTPASSHKSSTRTASTSCPKGGQCLSRPQADRNSTAGSAVPANWYMATLAFRKSPEISHCRARAAELRRARFKRSRFSRKASSKARRAPKRSVDPSFAMTRFDSGYPCNLSPARVRQRNAYIKSHRGNRRCPTNSSLCIEQWYTMHSNENKDK